MADKPKSKKVAGLRVVAQTNGFRRAGRAWGPDAVEVPASDFTKDQIAQLKGERELKVEDIEIEVVAE